jgi:putative colanic acid biosynthesis acetyltransferase WcaF
VQSFCKIRDSFAERKLLPAGIHSYQRSTSKKMDLSTFANADFDRGAPQWKEACWIVVRSFVFLSALPYPSGLKTMLLRWFGAKVGRNVVIRSQVNISFPWRLAIGDNVWIGDGVWILSLAQVVIESNVCISQRAYICSGSHNHRKSSFDLITKPIFIRERSWIAANAFVGLGVEIGPASVVAAGSVVFENFGPKVLIRGNPAQVVKTLEA